MEKDLNIFTISDGASGFLDVHKFWELSNNISEGEYERIPMHHEYDKALNSSILKLKTCSKKIKFFEPVKNKVGYCVFTIETGEKIARGHLKQILQLCKIKSQNILKSAKQYENKGMYVSALAEGKAGIWKFNGFVVFHDKAKSNTSV